MHHVSTCSWNDSMRSDAERAQLKQYITRLVGTNRGPELSQKRGWMAMDWLVRAHTAAWLALSPGLAHHAETLKALPPITCTAELVAAQPKIDAARQDARAERDAARAAAWDAAWDAAGAKLEPTVLALQASAHELFSKMIDAA